MNRWMQGGIAALLLAALAIAPVSGALCAVRCASAHAQAFHGPVAMSTSHATMTSTAHATTTQGCHGPSMPRGVQVRAESNHPCGDHDRMEDATASLIPGRGDTSLLLRTVATTAAAPPSELAGLAPIAARRAWRSLGPPVAPPAPTRSTLVLRI